MGFSLLLKLIKLRIFLLSFVSGIGIVNAIEVVHAFPEEDGLREFREWVESPDPSIFGKLYPHIGDEAKMCSSKAKNASGDGYGSFERDGGKELMDVKRTFMEKHVCLCLDPRIFCLILVAAALFLCL